MSMQKRFDVEPANDNSYLAKCNFGRIEVDSDYLCFLN